MTPSQVDQGAAAAKPPTGGLERFLEGSATAEVREKPQRAVSFKVTGIENAVQTGGGTGDYQRCKIVTAPTRGSANAFLAIMFREEMFTPGFSGSDYTNYTKYPALAQVNPNSKSTPQGTKGSGMRFVYESNVVPGVKRNEKTGAPVVFKKGPNAGQVMTTGPSLLQMCCGGTLEGLGDLLASLDKVYTGTPHTPETITDAIRAAIQRNQDVEHVAILKQSLGRDGELSDNFELAYYLGPLTQELYDDVTARAAKKEVTEKEAGRKLQVSFQL